jgi:hypothetical protein
MVRKNQGKVESHYELGELAMTIWSQMSDIYCALQRYSGFQKIGAISRGGVLLHPKFSDEI